MISTGSPEFDSCRKKKVNLKVNQQKAGLLTVPLQGSVCGKENQKTTARVVFPSKGPNTNAAFAIVCEIYR